MLIRVERSRTADAPTDELVAKRIVTGIKHTLLVSSTVELLEPGTLPRSEKKTKRIFDRRRFE